MSEWPYSDSSEYILFTNNSPLVNFTVICTLPFFLTYSGCHHWPPFTTLVTIMPSQTFHHNPWKGSLGDTDSLTWGCIFSDCSHYIVIVSLCSPIEKMKSHNSFLLYFYHFSGDILWDPFICITLETNVNIAKIPTSEWENQLLKTGCNCSSSGGLISGCLFYQRKKQ